MGPLSTTAQSAFEDLRKNLSFHLSSKLAKEITEISGGLGLQFGMYRLNYGIRFGSQNLGLPQMIDLTIQLP